MGLSKSIFPILLGLILASQVLGNSLETVNDEELEKLIQQEQYVLVLFSKDDEKSEDFETELSAVREDLVDTLEAYVVKAIDSPLIKNFTDKAEPAVVFIRKGIPVLYDGPANEEEILETIARNKEPCVQDLTDTNFEHLTQASTAATTGDWFVQFFKDECDQCELMRARLETLGCKFKGRANVARINKGTTGAVTGRRFEVAGVPEYIFFRQGRMYRYTIEKFDVDSMSNFMTGFFKNVKAESIPMPKTPFDDLVQMCVDYIRDYPLYVAGLTALPFILFAYFYFLLKSDDDEEDEPRSKKKKSKSKAKKDS